MAERAPRVTEFRSIVDKVIDNQRQSRHPSIYVPGSAEGNVMVHGLHFISVDGDNGRDNVVGMGPEHRWAVMQPTIRVGEYIGRVALVSVDGHAESLFRNWSFRTSSEFLPIVSSREYTDDESLNLALDWVRSPHVYPENLQALAALNATETITVARKFAQDNAAAAELEEDLRRLSESHRISPEDLRTYID